MNQDNKEKKMNKFTKEMVDSYADKLLIGLTKEENELVLKEFDIIDENMQIIADIPNISEVKPMTHALDDFLYVLRSDEEEESIPIEELLKNCDSYENAEIKVPKVVG